MSTPIETSAPSERITASRHVIDDLAVNGLISDQAHQSGLRVLAEHKHWGLWVSRQATLIGSALILVGIVYFFAFNWADIPRLFKLALLQGVLLACLCGVFFAGLGRFSGKILLLGAAVILGVTLAVFGQIYQTGADAYSLFVIWAVLIAPWVLVSRFAALWVLWLALCNLGAALFWIQAVLPDKNTQMLICTYLALFNAAALGLREYALTRGYEWLGAAWVRLVLLAATLACLFFPTVLLIMNPEDAPFAVIIGAVVAALLCALFFFLYRYKMKDILGLALIALFLCSLFETFIFKILIESNPHHAVLFFLMGTTTVSMFAFVCIQLLRISRKLGAGHV